MKIARFGVAIHADVQQAMPFVVGDAPRYSHLKEAETAAAAQAACERWGAAQRLTQCLQAVPRP